MLYVIKGIHALNAYLDSESAANFLGTERITDAIELVEPRMILRSKLSSAQTSFTMV